VSAPDSGLDIAGEITKLILSSNLTFLYGTTQVVQALATLLFTTYLAWLYHVADGKFAVRIPWSLLLLPAILWGFGVVAIFLNTIAYSYRGVAFTVGDLQSTVAAYEQTLRRRRRVILLPTVLTLAGLGSLTIILLWYA
jgi:hypothetical protein